MPEGPLTSGEDGPRASLESASTDQFRRHLAGRRLRCFEGARAERRSTASGRRTRPGRTATGGRESRASASLLDSRYIHGSSSKWHAAVRVRLRWHFGHLRSVRAHLGYLVAMASIGQQWAVRTSSN